MLKQILAGLNLGYSNEDLLALYTFTRGVAKYVSQLMDAGAVTKKAMIEHIISPNSLFLTEGKNNLIEEFGKDYGVYFSILSCISRGKNTRAEIEDVIGKEIGGYLTNLEKEYELNDVFYSFWFRFFFKYNYILEIENYEKLQEIINRDYSTFSGLMLERYFHQVAIESKKYTRLGRWWDRK